MAWVASISPRSVDARGANASGWQAGPGDRGAQWAAMGCSASEAARRG
jgi:hypothetical protein